MSEPRREAIRDPEDEAARLHAALREAREGRGPIPAAQEALEAACAYLRATGVSDGPLGLELNEAAEALDELFLARAYETRACGPEMVAETLRDLAMDLIQDECLSCANAARARGYQLFVDWEDADALLDCWGLRPIDAGNPRQGLGKPRRFSSADEALAAIGA